MVGPAVWFYDGRSALRRSAVLVDDGASFRLVGPEREDGPFAWDTLVASDADAGSTTFGMAKTTGWRMGFVDAPSAQVVAKLPGHARYGRLVDRFGLWRASVAFAALAALTVTLVLRTPAAVARLVPASVERRLGDVMVGDFGRNGCVEPAGQHALDALLRRVDDADRDLEVHVVRLKMVNAVTLPGGRIVVFDGLLQAARSPDEVAGVIGHELGHVRHHDVTEALVRQLGLSVLLGGLEGHVGGYTNALLATAYTRSAEDKADGFALDLLRDAGVSPAATAAFFQRLGKGSEGAERMLAYLNTHPVSADRARRFQQAVRPGATYRPALDTEQWQALRGICKGAKAEEGFNF